MQTSAAWSDSAIRDTVAAIVSQDAYQRTISESLLARIMEWIAAVFRWLYNLFAGSASGRTIVTILFVLLAMVVVVRMVIGIRAEERISSARRASVARRRAPELLAEAERLAAAGDYLAASHALCAALLLTFASAGDIKLHPSKTTGDYAREMRRKRLSYSQAFQLFRTRYDRAVYGSASVDASEYQELERAAKGMLTFERAA